MRTSEADLAYIQQSSSNVPDSVPYDCTPELCAGIFPQQA